MGPALTTSHRGFALNEKIADITIPYLYSLKYSGALAAQYKEAKPVGNCRATSRGSRNKRLTIQEMSGIWVATYGFAFIGLLLRAVQRYRESYKKQHKVMWVDQWGNAMPNPKALETLGFEKNEASNQDWSSRSLLQAMVDESRKSNSEATTFLSNQDPRIQTIMEQSKDLVSMDL